MEGKAKSKEKRRRYQRPQVKQVELRPEEAVLQGCKTIMFTGPKAIDCGPIEAPCEEAGS